MESLFNALRSIPDSPQALLEFVTNLFFNHGYLVVTIGAALDNFGLPASGDVVLFAGGWLASTDRAALYLIMLFGALGGWTSDNAMYWIGRIGGRPLVERLGKLPVLRRLLDIQNIGRAESYFEAHGGKTVFIGRFGPWLRSTAPLFSGLSRMKYPKFFAYNMAAVIVWAIAYTSVGYFFGEYWEQLLGVARSFGAGILALVVVTVIFVIYRRRRRRSRELL